MIDRATTAPDTVRMLLREVGRVLALPRRSPYVRVEVEAEPASPLAWLQAQCGTPRIYWHGRNEGTRTACAGTALSLAGDDYDVLADEINRLGPEARLYGGLRFDPLRTPEEGAWRSAEGFRFTLPRFTFTQHEDGRCTLACHLVLPRDRARREGILRQIRRLAPATPLETALPLPLSRHDLPDAAGWAQSVEAALEAFRTGALGKVVLARRVTFGFAEAVSPFALLARLEASTPGCFHFLTEHGPGASFVGASPERLFRQEGRRVVSEAVAGTRFRGASNPEDAALRDELLASEKDAREHRFVRTFVQQQLGALTTDLHLDEKPGEMTLARGRHLRSRIEGTLHPGVSPVKVLRALHPTPAVGGTPTEAALAFLRTHELFDRGRYAAPVGWLSRDDAEFAVGIRTGRVESASLALYSGAGLVEGSDPAQEWEEIEGKIADFVAVLGLDARR